MSQHVSRQACWAVTKEGLSCFKATLTKPTNNAFCAWCCKLPELSRPHQCSCLHSSMPCKMLPPSLPNLSLPNLQGIAPLRALAQWTPVQAQATANRVSLVYVAESQEGAAYVTEWDELREAGVSSTAGPRMVHDVQYWSAQLLLERHWFAFPGAACQVVTCRPQSERC